MASEPSPLIVILIINDYPSHHSHVSKNIVYWRERHEVLVCNQGCLRSCNFPSCGVAVLKMRMITNLFKFLPSAIIVSYYGFRILVEPAFLLPLVFSSLVCVCVCVSNRRIIKKFVMFINYCDPIVWNIVLEGINCALLG
jgi:hypothetical protein